MATPRKLTPQTPGEPIQEAENTEQTAPEAEQQAVEATETAPTSDTPADPEPQPKPTETAPMTADPVPVVERAPGELPDASEIDAKAIKQPVLTKQGYVVPEK